MANNKRKRMSSAQAKRLRTLRANKGPEWVAANASKAGKASPTHFNSERAKEANRKRWAAYREAKAREAQNNEGE